MSVLTVHVVLLQEHEQNVVMIAKCNKFEINHFFPHVRDIILDFANNNWFAFCIEKIYM